MVRAHTMSYDSYSSKAHDFPQDRYSVRRSSRRKAGIRVRLSSVPLAAWNRIPVSSRPRGGDMSACPHMSDCCSPHRKKEVLVGIHVYTIFWPFFPESSGLCVLGEKSLPTLNSSTSIARVPVRPHGALLAALTASAALVPMRNLHTGWRRFAGHPRFFARVSSRHKSPSLRIYFDQFSSERMIQPSSLPHVQQQWRSWCVVCGVSPMHRASSCSCRRLFMNDSLRER